MKKKKAKIICIVLALLLLLLAGFLYLQRDNLRAIKEGMDSSVAELEECMDENEQKLEDALSGISMRDLTEEEKAALRAGTLSREDMDVLLDCFGALCGIACMLFFLHILKKRKKKDR